MGEQARPNNLPGQEGYEWKAPPGYVGPNEQELALLGGLGYQGPGQGYTQGMAGLQGAYGQGGYSKIMPMLGKLADFMGKGGKGPEAYETAATQKLQGIGREGLKLVQSQMGGQGALGSSAHLGGLSDLGMKYAGERSNIAATAAGMKESNILNRLNAGAGALSNLGGLASYEQMNNANIGAQQAGLGLQEQQQGWNQNYAALGAEQQYRQEPMNWGYQLWPGGGSPNAASGGGGALPWVGVAADIFSAGMGVPGGWGGMLGGGGGGGGMGNMPRGKGGYGGGWGK